MATLTLNNRTEKEIKSKDTQKPLPQKKWTEWEKAVFRVAAIFFVIMSVPWETSWYAHLFNIDWQSLHYRDFHQLANYSPGFLSVPTESGRWGLASYASWFYVLLISTFLGTFWGYLDKNRKEYNLLYYWVRTIVRYRAAIGIIGFGFTKVLPVQMPYPSLGLLNTNFGDFTGHHIFWMSIGIVPWYQIFTGVVEVLAGILLLFRKTTFLGTIILIGTLLTIVIVNFSYEGGVHGYSSYFVILGAFLLVYYIKDIINLLFKEKVTTPVDYYPNLNKIWRFARYGFKSIIIVVFIFYYFYLQLINFQFDPYKQPSIAGVKELRGNYHVSVFRLNGEEIPYSPVDPVRWQEATFEKWTTLTFRVNAPQYLNLSNGGGDPMQDINRNFEIAGVAGGQKVFYYEADTVDKVLYLQDKNVPSLANVFEPGFSNVSSTGYQDIYPHDWISKSVKTRLGDPAYKINPKAINTRRLRSFAPGSRESKDVHRKKMVFAYKVLDGGNKVILEGTGPDLESLYIELDKYERVYALSPASLNAGEY